MITVYYSTETPIIASDRYHFDYASKRDAYIDACYAILCLNQAAKSAPDNYRYYIYRLKNRWIEHLYQKGFCVQAMLEDSRVWCLVFLVNGIRFQWHMPDKAVTWRIEEKRAPVQFEYVKGLPLRTRPLEEAIALLEWLLS
jgi:hypothetical protein